MQTQETRSELIFRHTKLMLHEQRTSMQTFSVSVVGWYHEHVLPAARTVIFKVDDDTYRCVATNAQRLNRYMDPEIDTRLPVDLEEAWVEALTEPYRSRCKADLQRRFGFLPVAIPGATAADALQSVSLISGEFGQVLQAWAPVMVNGALDAADKPHIPRVLQEIDDLAAAVLAFRAGLAAQMAAD